MTEKRKALGRGLESLLPPRPFSNLPPTFSPKEGEQGRVPGVTPTVSPNAGGENAAPTLSPQEGEQGEAPTPGLPPQETGQGGTPGAGVPDGMTTAGTAPSPAQSTAARPAPRLATEEPYEVLLEIPVDRVAFSRYQPRKACDQERLDELARSIEEVGLVQPIVVRPRNDGWYELVAGERRLRAAQQAGFDTIHAIVRDTSDLQSAEMALLENLQREDLNPMEQAAAFQQLGSGGFHLTQDEIAKRTGKDRSTVANFLRLLKLPQEVQEMVAGGGLSLGHAKALMSLPTPSLMIEMARKMVKNELTVRQAEALVGGLVEARSKEKKERVVDPNVREAEETLHRALGVPVTITDRNGKGKIVLEYGSLEDFDRILGAVMGK